MSSPPPPQYNEPTNLLTKFNTLLAYASTHGTYLLQDSQYRIFETTFENSQTINSILLQFTTPIAVRNVQAIRRLRTLQISNFRLACAAYERLVTPHLLQQINQDHYPGQRDSPPPMRILTPPRSNSPRFAGPVRSTIPNVSTTRTRNNITRINLQQHCFKCRSTSHVKRHCPRYRCQHCRHLQPGHLARNCPNLPLSDQEYDLGHDYDPDGNLNGEQ